MANAFRDIVPQCAASTSSSSKKPCYEVFINHRGIDVKRNLASSIYHMLDLVGVPVFLDQEELEVGELFSQEIEEAMRSASVHIAIFSPNYADSPCLEELSFMLKINVAIIPVFYGVAASDVRYAKGLYADAFRRLEKKHRCSPEKIKEWKEALNRVSFLNGCMLDANKDEGKLLREIVDSALLKRKKVPLEVATFSVGLEEAVQAFESRVGSSTGKENVHIVGIVGMGGAGKTTLAKELYNRKCSSFSRSCFLSNVRDFASKNTLTSLQKILLKGLSIDHSEILDINQGKGYLARDLRSTTVLIVLDDVDDVDQIDALLPKNNKLGRGSFIIVTTRMQDVLTTWGISSIYPIKLLDPCNAKQLFCRHAFLQPYWHTGFELLDKNYHNFQDLIKRFVEVCRGLPLSLKVLGAMVSGLTKSEWEIKLQKLSRILPDKIADCLKLSYTALDSEVQKLFLDTACFFVGEEKRLVTAIWDGSGWSGEDGLKTLINKCLVSLDNTDCIEMHDHLRDLGRAIAKDLSPSRIWKEEQILDREGRTVRGIVFEGIGGYRPTLEHYMLPTIRPSSCALEHSMLQKIRPSMRALQLLAVSGHDFREEFGASDLVWLRVHGFHGTNLPSWLSLRNLTVLELYSTTNLEELWQDNVQVPLQLRVLIISVSRGTSFRGLPKSIGRLTHLKKMVLNGSSLMRSFPEEFCRLESLEVLELSSVGLLSSLPIHFLKLIKLRRLIVNSTKLKALPDSLGNLANLETLDLGGNQLTTLPDSLGNLANLQTLDLGGNQLTTLPDSLGNLANLQTLDLRKNQLTTLPDSFGNLANLQMRRW